MPAAIAAGHPSTAEAGALTLAAGGNAVDACIVAAFVAFVTEGPLAGPTGGGFCLVHEPDKPALLEVMIDVNANAYPKIAFGKPLTEMEPFAAPVELEGEGT